MRSTAYVFSFVVAALIVGTTIPASATPFTKKSHVAVEVVFSEAPRLMSLFPFDTSHRDSSPTLNGKRLLANITNSYHVAENHSWDVKKITAPDPSRWNKKQRKLAARSGYDTRVSTILVVIPRSKKGALKKQLREISKGASGKATFTAKSTSGLPVDVKTVNLTTGASITQRIEVPLTLMSVKGNTLRASVTPRALLESSFPGASALRRALRTQGAANSDLSLEISGMLASSPEKLGNQGMKHIRFGAAAQPSGALKPLHSQALRRQRLGTFSKNSRQRVHAALKGNVKTRGAR